jgi:hypothetical protein
MRSSRVGRWVARFLLFAALLTGAATAVAASDSPDDWTWTSNLTSTNAVR